MNVPASTTGSGSQRLPARGDRTERGRAATLAEPATSEAKDGVAGVIDSVLMPDNLPGAPRFVDYLGGTAVTWRVSAASSASGATLPEDGFPTHIAPT